MIGRRRFLGRLLAAPLVALAVRRPTAGTVSSQAGEGHLRLCRSAPMRTVWTPEGYERIQRAKNAELRKHMEAVKADMERQMLGHAALTKTL